MTPLLLLAVWLARPDTNPLPGNVSELYRLDRLPVYRTAIKVGMASSYDRSGGNDDGFSGKDSFIRKEGDWLVIADLRGPGVITRIWTPTPTDDPIAFYFDGETTPRLTSTWRGMFMGGQSPFLSPLVGNGGGGFYCYVPLAFKESCKVAIKAPRVQFYQINYALYRPDSGIESFTADRSSAQQADVDKVKSLWSRPGQDITSYTIQPNSQPRILRAKIKLVPGRTSRVFESSKGGRIAGIRFSPASAFAGKDRSAVLRIHFDGDRNPAVEAPVGDFFGFAWGQPSMQSLLVGVQGDTAYCYLPMPFDRSARIELSDERAYGSPREIQAEVVQSDMPRQLDEGRFYAVWNRENPTVIGKPFTYVDCAGKGHVVGVALQGQGLVSGSTPFFEGDDQCTIDGELVAHGTGSEDSFNGGWYDVPGRWEGKISFPLSGCLAYNRSQARSGGFRFFLTDAQAFRQNIKFGIEHAPEKNSIETDYTAVTYLYADSNPNKGRTLLPVAQRTVRDLDRLIYTPGWYLPIHSFSIRNATLTKADGTIEGRRYEWLSMRAEKEDIFGPHHLSLLCGVPAAGRYRVSIEALEGPDCGIVQLFHQERAVGDKVDLYTERHSRRAPAALGELDMSEGPNQVFLKLVGKNPKATALGLDLVSVILERLP